MSSKQKPPPPPQKPRPPAPPPQPGLYSAPKAQTVMRKHYIALVLKDEDSRFGISFPDFPGAVTAAPTLDEAFERAEEALAQHVEGMAEHGEPIPPPSGFTEVIKDNPDAMPVLVPLPLAKAVR